MSVYLIHYSVSNPQEVRHARVAESDQAIALTRFALEHPGVHIESIRPAKPLLDETEQDFLLSSLATGDEVWWEDPDESMCSDYAVVVALHEEGELSRNSMITLVSRNGSEIEALAGELH